MLVLDLCIKGTTIEERPLHPCHGCLRTPGSAGRKLEAQGAGAVGGCFFNGRIFQHIFPKGFRILILYRDKMGVVTLRLFQGIPLTYGNFVVIFFGI